MAHKIFCDYPKCGKDITNDKHGRQVTISYKSTEVEISHITVDLCHECLNKLVKPLDWYIHYQGGFKYDDYAARERKKGNV